MWHLNGTENTKNGTESTKNGTENETDFVKNGTEKNQNETDILQNETDPAPNETDKPSNVIRREKMLELMRIHPKITTNELANILSIARSTISRYIEFYKSEGRLDRDGDDHGGRWIVK